MWMADLLIDIQAYVLTECVNSFGRAGTLPRLHCRQLRLHPFVAKRSADRVAA